MNFIICAPDYNPQSGGIIVLHYLCHLLNSLGFNAYITREPGNFEISRFNLRRPILLLIREYLRNTTTVSTNSFFNTPKLSNLEALKLAQQDSTIVIYGEMVFGNPLAAKNVLRYLLHIPGNRSGVIYYGVNEFHIWQGEVSTVFNYPFSKPAERSAPINYYPSNIFPPDLWLSRPPLSNDLINTRELFTQLEKLDRTDIAIEKNWVCIDNLSLQEQARSFSEADLFISYDEVSFLTVFASLSGCDSVIIPPPGKTIQQWHPDIIDRYGIAYGFENIEWARNTRPLLYSKIKGLEDQAMQSAGFIAEESIRYFS